MVSFALEVVGRGGVEEAGQQPEGEDERPEGGSGNREPR